MPADGRMRDWVLEGRIEEVTLLAEGGYKVSGPAVNPTPECVRWASRLPGYCSPNIGDIVKFRWMAIGRTVNGICMEFSLNDNPWEPAYGDVNEWGE